MSYAKVSMGRGDLHCASVAFVVFDCGGFITSGQERQTFNSLPFGSISTHCPPVYAGGTLMLAWIPAFAGVSVL